MTTSTESRVVVADYLGPGGSRAAYRLAREHAGRSGSVVVVHPLSPMINYFGAVSEAVAADRSGEVLDEIDHRMLSAGLGGHDDEAFIGPLEHALLAAAREHGASEIIVGEDLGLTGNGFKVTVAPGAPSAG